MLPVVVFPFLHVLNLDVHGEAFGHELKLVPEAFHQHAGVPLDLFQPRGHLAAQFLEPRGHFATQLLEPRSRLITQPLEPLGRPADRFSGGPAPGADRLAGLAIVLRAAVGDPLHAERRDV